MPNKLKAFKKKPNNKVDAYTKKENDLLKQLALVRDKKKEPRMESLLQ
jgi:hypothetical protein